MLNNMLSDECKSEIYIDLLKHSMYILVGLMKEYI